MLAQDVESLLSPGWYGQRIPRACVIGLGLIGGSWAGALHRQGWSVCAVETESSSLELAFNRGWIKEGWAELPAWLDVDLVVLALPLHALLNGLAILNGRVSKGAIITDVGSVKSEICEKAKTFLGEEVFFVGGHPMTGSEKSGFMVADAELFKGYPYVLTPADAPSEVVARLTGLLESFGAIVAYRASEQHDTEVALVSHIPHVLSVSLALAVQDVVEQGLAPVQLAGRSFRELTRIADSSPEMWKEILLRNRTAIIKGLEIWQKRLAELSEYVQQGDGEGVVSAFRQAHTLRHSINVSDNKNL